MGFKGLSMIRLFILSLLCVWGLSGSAQAQNLFLGGDKSGSAGKKSYLFVPKSSAPTSSAGKQLFNSGSKAAKSYSSKLSVNTPSKVGNIDPNSYGDYKTAMKNHADGQKQLDKILKKRDELFKKEQAKLDKLSQGVKLVDLSPDALKSLASGAVGGFVGSAVGGVTKKVKKVYPVTTGSGSSGGSGGGGGHSGLTHRVFQY